MIYLYAISKVISGMHHVYCISGLGADFRIFQQLQLHNATLHPIEWTMPDAGETLPQYAARLAAQIKHPQPVLLGVSFGGMLATEISRIMPVQQTIIISSCKCKQELPAWMRTAGKLRLHKIIPYWMVTQFSSLNKYIFDTQSKAEDLYIKQMMLKDTHHLFVKRAVNMILTWQAQTPAHNIMHIHGRADKLLLPKRVQANYWLNDAGHFMIWNRADEVSQYINAILDSLVKG